MNRLFLILTVFIAAFLNTHLAMAGSIPIPAAPAIDVRAYILQDFNSGKVIAEQNADERLEPASITKIMTAYVLFDAIQSAKLSFDDQVLISEKAWNNPEVPGWSKGSRMFVEVGSKVKVSDLLRGLIVQSGNDASVALAEHLAGTEEAFASLMNSYAKQLGLNGTQYQNSTGWPAADHYTTARDIATLTHAMIRNFPDLYKIYSEKRFTYNNISQSNRNALLWKDSSVDGVKTGYTESAGYCLASSAERNGMRLISVLMGASSSSTRIKNSQSLLSYGFRFYETHKLFAAGKVLKEARVWKGASENLTLGLKHDLYVTIPHGEYKSLKPVMDVKKSIFAPVMADEPLGEVRVQLNDNVLATQPLIALDTVEQGSFFSRMVDHVRYMLQ